MELNPTPTSISSIVSRRISGDQICLVWRGELTAKTEPPLIVVPERNLKEFFAFSSTYVSTISPITAFFRVVSLEQLASVSHSQAEFDLGKTVVTTETLAGVLIAETYLQMGDWTRSLDSVTIQACLATISASVAMGVAKGFGPGEVEDVVRSWDRARRLITDEPLRVSPDVVGEFWFDVLTAFLEPLSRRKKSARFAPIIADLLQSQSIDNSFEPRAWRELVAEIPDVKDALIKMQGSREERVRGFDKYSAILLASDHVDIKLREFVAGALLTMVSEGSFDYMPLCEVFEKSLPKAVLWFGLLSSISRQGHVLVAGNSLGRRVSKLIATGSDIFSSPQDDISLAELEVVASAERRGDLPVRTVHQSLISVEIYPGVSARYRLAKGGSRHEADVRDSLRNSEDIRELRYLLGRAARMVDRLDAAQADLFEKPYRKTYMRGPKV